MRDYGDMLKPKGGIWVPRWMGFVALLLAVSFIGFSMLKQPTWLVKRLDSPDGKTSAVLKRTQYVDYQWRIDLKKGKGTRHLWTSPEFKMDWKVDQGEKLRWSEDSRYLFFFLEGKPVFAYDLEENGYIKPEAAELIFK